ncbi:MAG TPA: DinB family protein [Longimicrobiales bacterium]|nr:DinB family protein [Longimicrobiales bacterium]
MTRLEEIRELYEYNRWANQRMLEAVAALPEEDFVRDLGSSFPSIRDTLVHVLSAEWVWLSRMNGRSPRAFPAEWKLAGLGVLNAEWDKLARELEAFVAALSEPDLDRLIPYHNLAGRPFTSTLSQMLRHCVNHSSYHRGQVTTMLRQLGAAAPATDLIRYYRETASGD